MAHVAPEPPSRRRIDIVVGIALAVVGVAVAVVAVIALRSPQGREAGRISESASSGSASASSLASTSRSVVRSTAAKPTTDTNQPSRRPSTSRPPLVVLDNTGNVSLAQTAKDRFVAGGWQVTSTGELVNDILSTVAYYDPAYPGAQQAAVQLQQQFPAIKRVAPRFPELPPAPIVVVLTSDYS